MQLSFLPPISWSIVCVPCTDGSATISAGTMRWSSFLQFGTVVVCLVLVLLLYVHCKQLWSCQDRQLT